MEMKLLDKDKYRGYKLEFRYKTSQYYHVEIDREEVFSLRLIKRSFDMELEKGFDAELYPDYLEDGRAFEFIDNGNTIGYIEIDRESWNNRLRITELLVLDKYRNSGYGSRIMDRIKDIGKDEGFRELILETQSCNSNAIDFYIKNGFTVNGIDLSSYTNEDVEKKEVRLEMVYRF